MRRFLAFYAAPTAVLLAAAVLPLAAGGQTLFLRDVFSSHLEMKWAQAEAMRGGYLPLIDPYRAGGQPALGNPNSVPLYPDNLLYLVAPFLWAFNAHFWLHWLLAPLAMYALARSWGLGRQGAWAGGVCYAFSGYLVSNLAFYNLMAGVALTPALVAAFLAAGRRRGRGWPPAAAGLLWALILGAGDPLVAVQALALGAGAVLVREGWRPAGALRLAAAVVAGTLLAAPQVVEFLRILPLSFRGHWGYSAAAVTAASWDPRQAVEWLIPFFFGRPDLLEEGRFWGQRFFAGAPPYYFSLYPGLLALGLAAAGSRRRGRGAAWAWGAVGAGLFFSLGRFNPAAAWLFALPLARVARYPVKFWLPVAVGASLLCAWGFERAVFEGDRRSRRVLAATLGSLAGLLAAAWVLLTFFPAAAEAGARALIPAPYPASFVANERLRWAGLCLISLTLLAAFGALVALARRRVELGGALLLALHAAAQLFLLRPAVPTDAVEPYLERPPLAAAMPRESRVVHGAAGRLFGPSRLLRGEYPDGRVLWRMRRAFRELYPFAGPLWGLRYELNLSPEGLDSFLTRAANDAMETSSDPDRLRLLAAWGVDHLLLDRPLEGEALGLVRLVGRDENFGQPVFLYALPGAAPEVQLLGSVLRAPHLNAAVELLAEPSFDPRRSVVLPGAGAPVEGPRGRVRILAVSPESLRLEVRSARGGAVLVQRAHLPLYRAAVDGEPRPVVPGNLHRVAVEVPPGSHRVEVWIDRRPLAASGAAAVLGLAALAALALALPRRRAGKM